MATECLCCSVCPQLICVCYKNCGESDLEIHCPKYQAQTQAQAGTLESVAKPPDMKRSQLALKKWTTMVKTSGMAETLPADIILDHGIEQAPVLCKEMSKHFDNSLRGNSEGIEKIVTWLKAEFRKNKQEDRAKALNQFQEGVQEEMKREIPTLFETDLQPPHKLFQALEKGENPKKRTEHLCKTCRDEHKDGTYHQNWEGSRSENSCSFYKVCGKPEDSCLGCSNVCKKAQRRCRCPHCHYITTEVKGTEAEPQPIYKLLQALEIGQNSEEGIDKEVIKLIMLVDWGPLSTIVGVENSKQTKKQYTSTTHSSLEYSQSNKQYEFNCGCKIHSLGKMNCPIYVVDKNMHSHPLCVCAEIFNQPRIPLLLGNENLIRMRGVFNFEDDTLTIESKDRRLCSSTHLESSRHLHLQFYSPNFIFTVHRHQDWDQGHPEATKHGERRAEMLEENISTVINDLNHCNVCIVEHNSSPRPTRAVHMVEDVEVVADLQPLHKEVCGKPQDSCPRCCKTYEDAQRKCRCSYCHYITIEVKETEVEFQPIYELLRALQPNRARDVSPPMDAAIASVSQIYDAQKESGLVLLEETEATSKVSQSIKQLANSNLLHGIPDPQPLIPPPNATEDKEKKTRVGEMSKEDLFRMKDRRLVLPINLEQIINHGRHQNTEPLDEHVKCTCYTNCGDSQIINDGRHQDTDPLDGHAKCTCYTDCGESQIINDGYHQEHSKIARYLIKNCKCQRIK